MQQRFASVAMSVFSRFMCIAALLLQVFCFHIFITTYDFKEGSPFCFEIGRVE